MTAPHLEALDPAVGARLESALERHAYHYSGEILEADTPPSEITLGSVLHTGTQYSIQRLGDVKDDSGVTLANRALDEMAAYLRAGAQVVDIQRTGGWDRVHTLEFAVVLTVRQMFRALLDLYAREEDALKMATNIVSVYIGLPPHGAEMEMYALFQRLKSESPYITCGE